MRIYLMRHGDASYQAPHDDLRQLTDKGRDRIQWNISQKRDELSLVEAFFTSPILRAKQTSELGCALLGRKDAISVVSWLIHESKPSRAIQELSQLKVNSALLFSHQPFASHFVESLCQLQPGEIQMNTASIVAIDADPIAAGFGTILWQLP